MTSFVVGSIERSKWVGEAMVMGWVCNHVRERMEARGQVNCGDVWRIWGLGSIS